MTELQINLTITALTLVVASGIGMLAEDLSEYLDKPGIESLSAEYKITRADSITPVKSTEAGQETGLATAKVTIK